MSRSTVTDSVLAGAATIVVAWPLTTLFTPNTWVQPTVVMVAVVVAAGVLARRLTGSWLVVTLAQLVAVTLMAGWLYGRGHLWHGLPQVDTILAFNRLLVDARVTVQSYAAPAPTNRGITLGIGLAIALTAMLVDHLAVMRRSPAMAGLPLLTAFLISASNSGDSLNPLFFLASGGMWLVLLGRQGVTSLRRWSTTMPMSTGGRRHADDRDGAFGYAAVGRTLAIAGLVSAVALPVVVPHLPTRYLIDGLGRSTGATGFSDGQIGLTTTVDVARNLRSPSNAPVLTYTSTAKAPSPLRVAVLVDYRDGTWRPDGTKVEFSRTPVVPAPRDLSDSVAREPYRINVLDSRLEAPQLAAPFPITAGDLDGVPWGVDPESEVARVNRSAKSYSLDYLDLAPRTSTLAQRTTDRLTDITHARELRVDPESTPALREMLTKVVPEGANRIEAAIAIQEYLREQGGFTYALDLAATPTGPDGQGVDAITAFLRTKRGYCVQFASTMVQAARLAGIPARMAVGFLPGTLDKGTYTVKAADAHAWPELYFKDVGWLRFEPTPSNRTGVAPAYSVQGAPSQDGAGPTDAPTGGASAAPTRDAGANDPGASDPASASGATGNRLTTWWSGGRLTLVGWVVLALLLGILGSLAVPLAARARLRRRLRHAPDEASRVEVEWQAMVERIGDLGVIAPRGSTPRQAGRFYQREAYLEGDQSQALARIVDGVERSRYARPGTTLSDIRADTQHVVKAVSGVRRRKDRLRAAWWPADGLTEWRERRADVTRRVREPWERLQEWRTHRKD